MDNTESRSDTVSRITRQALLEHADELIHIEDPDVLVNNINDAGTDVMLSLKKYRNTTITAIIEDTHATLNVLSNRIQSITDDTPPESQ